MVYGTTKRRRAWAAPRARRAALCLTTLTVAAAGAAQAHKGDGHHAFVRSPAYDSAPASTAQPWFLAYQLQKDARTGEVVGHEALFRTKPLKFETGQPSRERLLQRMDMFGQILTTAIREHQILSHHHSGRLLLSVNTRYEDLRAAGLAGLVKTIAQENNLPLHRLQLEVVEHRFLTPDHPVTRDNLRQLRDFGVAIAADDVTQDCHGMTESGLLHILDHATTFKLDGSLDHIGRLLVAARLESMLQARGIGLGDKTLVLEHTSLEEASAMVGSGRLNNWGQILVQSYPVGYPEPAAQLLARPLGEWALPLAR